MSDWLAFAYVVGSECVNWLFSMQILGVSVGGIMIGSALLCIIIRAILWKV